MNVVDVVKRVEEIRSTWDVDGERAHALECSLHREVLWQISQGCRDPKGLAAAALRTVEMDEDVKACRLYIVGKEEA